MGWVSSFFSFFFWSLPLFVSFRFFSFLAFLKNFFFLHPVNPYHPISRRSRRRLKLYFTHNRAAGFRFRFHGVIRMTTAPPSADYTYTLLTKSLQTPMGPNSEGMGQGPKTPNVQEDKGSAAAERRRPRQSHRVRGGRRGGLDLENCLRRRMKGIGKWEDMDMNMNMKGKERVWID